MGATIYTARHAIAVRLLIERRKALGLRQADLAGRMGKSQDWVSNVELGRRRIDHVEFMALFEALGVRPGRLMTRKLEPIPADEPKSAQNARRKRRRPKS